MRSAIITNLRDHTHFSEDAQNARNLVPLQSVKPFGPLVHNRMGRVVGTLYSGAKLTNFVMFVQRTASFHSVKLMRF